MAGDMSCKERTKGRAQPLLAESDSKRYFTRLNTIRGC